MTLPPEECSPIEPSHGSELKSVRPRDQFLALGMAVAFLMADPAFQQLGFGHWARVLAGQVRRGHYLLVTDRKAVVGFVGWALANRDNADAWLAGRRELSFEESKGGEIVILNAWKAVTPAANRFLVFALREMFHDKQALYYKRFYASGRVRPVRLRVNAFVPAHLGRLRKVG